MAKKYPNILFFGIDSLRSDHMSLYGYHRLTTPHIDAYIEDGGVTFDKMYSPSIPTTPGYASMVTGMDCVSTDCVALRHKGPLTDAVRTMPEILRDYDNDVILVEHEDLNDESQSIHYINVPTEAADETTGTHTSVVGTTVITDRVTLENTIPGLTYGVNGTLVYQADCVDANGVEHHQGDVIATHEPVTVVAEDTTTIVMISFEVDSSALEGISGVVFEDVTHNDVIVATHYDYEALSQTPQWPKVRTDAVDGTTNSSTGAVAEETTIIDRVTLTNLVIGETYKVRGVLMDKSTSSEFISGGARVTAESDEFEATAAEMTVDLTFTFSSEDLGGRSLVVFEKLYCVSDNGTNEVANHEDINDANQTVDYPAIETNANDGQTGDEVGTVGETETIIDTVTYHNLIVGEEYTITGDLHYIEAFTDMNGNFHEAGDVVMDNNGMPITASVTFVAETAEGSVDLIYTVNSELLRGTSVVVFEDLYYNDVLIGSHADINDENQRVDYPDVSTTAKDDATDAHVGSTGVITVVDVVTLTNLVVGRTYTVNGVLMDKATGEALLDRNGNEQIIEGEDLLARCLCHELDHLDGILYIDKMIREVDPEGEDGEDEEE